MDLLINLQPLKSWQQCDDAPVVTHPRNRPGRQDVVTAIWVLSWSEGAALLVLSILSGPVAWQVALLWFAQWLCSTTVVTRFIPRN